MTELVRALVNKKWAATTLLLLLSMTFLVFKKGFDVDLIMGFVVFIVTPMGAAFMAGRESK